MLCLFTRGLGIAPCPLSSPQGNQEAPTIAVPALPSVRLLDGENRKECEKLGYHVSPLCNFTNKRTRQWPWSFSPNDQDFGVLLPALLSLPPNALSCRSTSREHFFSPCICHHMARPAEVSSVVRHPSWVKQRTCTGPMDGSPQENTWNCSKLGRWLLPGKARGPYSPNHSLQIFLKVYFIAGQQKVRDKFPSIRAFPEWLQQP